MLRSDLTSKPKMNIRSIFYRILLFSIAFSQASCMTHRLHQRYESTFENVSGFYVSADEKSLVVIGKNHHFVFPLDPDLKGVLSWKNRTKVQANFSSFEIFSDSRIAGNYRLLVDSKSIEAADQNYLLSLGFTLDRGAFQLIKKMEGKYYLATSVSSSTSFNKTYSIELIKDTSLPTPVVVALTPITVAADGALWIVTVGGAILLMPLYCIGNNIVTGEKCFSGGL